MHIERNVYEKMMEKYFRTNKALKLTQARSAEEFFGFDAKQVIEIHFHKQGFGKGLWFRLSDGRVFDAAARADVSDRSWYDVTTH